ncbi:4Fe-4S dicluster domain-containing protein [Sulfurospirillum sp. 1612]|uniref:4Fe-4S dicluster domain-containing protein n=1 Tax=Sulfurospirillum sp. 1612 TaxID=3094835 RepID=UPI002F9219F0
MDSKRRGFFKTLSPYKDRDESAVEPIRLPYHHDPLLFESVCVTCESKPCATVCDENIIMITQDGSPALDLSKRGCTYCEECAKACDRGVLDPNIQDKQIKAQVSLNIGKCIAWDQVICSSCADVCYDKAIKFLGMLRPEIVQENCTNCGFCIGVCPTEAIEISAKR